MTSAKGAFLVVDADAESLRSITNILAGPGYSARRADAADRRWHRFEPTYRISSSRRPR